MANDLAARLRSNEIGLEYAAADKIEHLTAALDAADQRTQAASAAAWIAAREAVMKESEDRRRLYAARQRSAADRKDNEKLDHWHARQCEAGEMLAAIRALPPPSDAAAALAEVVRRAKEDEREACAVIADAVADRYRGRTSLVSQGRFVGAQEVSLSIRARSEGEGA
jgi:hypothetical protein